MRYKKIKKLSTTIPAVNFILFSSRPELLKPPLPPAALTATQVKHQFASLMQLLVHSLLCASSCRKPSLFAGQCNKCCSTAEGAVSCWEPPLPGDEPPDNSFFFFFFLVIWKGFNCLLPPPFASVVFGLIPEVESHRSQPQH